MKYYLQLRAIAYEDQTIQEKHSGLIAGLSELPNEWRLRADLLAPEAGNDPSAILSVTKLLGKGVKGNIIYQKRRPFTDKAVNDDYIDYRFNPAKVSYAELINTVVPSYILAFTPYYAKVNDEEFTYRDYEKERDLGSDPRYVLYRLPPVSFLDRTYCQRSLDMSPEEVVDKLFGHVAEAKLIANGVYIVLSSKPLPTEEMDKLCWKAKGILMK
tara:strand:- start:168 stop:809 length:642 start_codon:yes stop_codon:yes gene_type:complete